MMAQASKTRLTGVLAALGVASSSWYRPAVPAEQRKRPGPAPKPIPLEITRWVIAMARANPWYGYKKIAIMCRRADQPVKNRQAYRVMAEAGLLHKPICRKAELYQAAKLFELLPNGPNDLWQMDVTYIHIPGYGWWYAITVIDYYSRYLLTAYLTSSYSAVEAIHALGLAQAEAERLCGPLTKCIESSERPTVVVGRNPYGKCRTERLIMDKISLLYLTATHNSGSTVIAVLANSHPDLISPGELMGPGGGHPYGEEGPVCSCGQVIARCPFWSEIGRRMSRLGHWWRSDYWGLMYDRGNRPTPLLTRLLYGRPGPYLLRDRFLRLVPFFRGRTKTLQRRNLDIIRLALAVSGKRCLLDTSKPPERMIRLSQIREIDLRAVHLIRDPRGWCYSRKKHSGHPVDMTSSAWVKRNRYIIRLLQALPKDKRMCVRYEGFCHEPQKVMNTLYDLAGLPPAPLPADMDGITHHLLGNRMRNRRDSEVREDTSWRQGLSREEIRVIEAKTRPLAEELGYQF